MGSSSSNYIGVFIMDLITGGLYQGQDNYISENYEKGFELYPFVREAFSQGLPEEEIFLKIMDENPPAINALEIGAGMIPVDSFDREFREVYGRIVCKLSDKSKRVIRMVCNLPIVIK